MATPFTEKDFVALITTYQKIIHKVCSMYCDTPSDKQDLFQEILMQIWRAYPSFQHKSKVSSWMYRVALNTAISSFRKQKRRVNKTSLSVEELNIPDAVYKDDYEEKRHFLYRAIKRLNKVERAIIMLYLEEHSYKEISQIIGITETNVGVKINRIKTKLRNIIQPLYSGT